MPETVSDEEVDRFIRDLERDAKTGGYHVNPDREFTRSLARGLLANRGRYGYIACPCRLASGNREDDLDIVCPCDYRDPDLADYGACYCALYVAPDVVAGTRAAASVPERRPPPAERRRRKEARTAAVPTPGTLKYPVWRCRVCGYLCARNEPPEACPICRVPRDRFERFL
ncbi:MULTISPECIES: ferredoxin-thioredoxin reductase catalytic domain-containing protein [unclassified Methanoculleus]|uniref:ferredoxin:thioredoxin reductase n=1 Tax=Methanoculleus palmolei TaxID=72612 RepID=A0ABD8AA36_9EURY|nr:ferredoxin-thioredoxin reductase catalytic domain-containing protein [Methanoculleus sp. UBA377]MDD2473915.1 ferredoxin-thioredoxin reductase catalytic domain-containing protein [Methanoculleus sp.]WOX56391.1 ferredoxin-thioredoxin reductase catalytic domain-containing protein [Methanoculleus palmolei]